jgi:hypothetical protein
MPGAYLAVIVATLAASGANGAWVKPADPGAWARKAYKIYAVDKSGRPLTSHAGGVKLLLDGQVGYRSYPNQKTPYFSTDSQGYRPTFPSGDTDAPVVFFTGGSLMFGHGASGDAATLASRVAALLPAYRVVNSGTSGFRSDNEASILFRDLERFKAKEVVSVSGYNEIINMWRCLPAKCDELSRRGFFLDDIEERLIGYMQLTSPSVYSSSSAQPRVFWSKEQALQDALDYYLDNLVRMKRWSAQFDAGFTVLFQPLLFFKAKPAATETAALKGVDHYFPPVDDESRIAALSHWFHERFIPACAKRGLDCGDLNDSTPMREATAPLFIDEVHLSDEGNKVFAAEVVEHLRKPLKLPAK